MAQQYNLHHTLGMEDLLCAHIPESAEVLTETDVDPGALSALLRNRWPDGCDLLVIDDYALDETFEPGFRPWAKRSLVLEDIPNRRLAGDLVLDPTPARTRWTRPPSRGSPSLNPATCASRWSSTSPTAWPQRG